MHIPIHYIWQREREKKKKKEERLREDGISLTSE